MRTILLLILSLQVLFLSFMYGRIYEINKHLSLSDRCIIEALDKQEIHKYYGHDIEFQYLYPHAEAYTHLKYSRCMMRNGA